MLYTIKGVKRETLPTKAGGTWQKVSVKTQETGETIMELGNGHSKMVKDRIKVGDTINGHIETRTWVGANGNQGTSMSLEGMTADYIYKLLLLIDPDIESKLPKSAGGLAKPPLPANEGWEGEPANGPTAEEVGF